MIVLTSDSSDIFVESESHYSLKRYKLGIGILCLLVIVGIVQTQWFVSLLPGPSVEQIRTHIEKSRRLQASISRDYHNSEFGKADIPKGIIIYESLFNDKQLKSLNEARSFILEDEPLQDELRGTYGVSLRDVDAVVVPGWAIDTPDNNGIIGITIEGWKGCTDGKGESDVGGFTIRDRPDHPDRRTEDGRPRIFLNANAFQSTSALRLTLFHEMLHAMNIPGHQTPLIFAQNDLTYLPEYRAFILRARLEGNRRETLIWILAVGVPTLLGFFVIRQHAKVSRSLRSARHT